MTTSKQLHRLARNPHAYMQFMATGKLPVTVNPGSPLITLLDRISPRDRAAIIGLMVGPALGYTGSRRFHSAEAALRWMRPDTEMLSAQCWPAESWRNKRFSKHISLADLLVHATRVPERLSERYPHL